VAVVQPDVGRAGGLTRRDECAIWRVPELTIVPHLWNRKPTRHPRSVCIVEYRLSELCESSLRERKVNDELTMRVGLIALPAKPA